MPIFQYKAFDKNGSLSEGHIEANNAQMAQKKLRQQKLFVKEIKEDIAKRDRELFPFLSKILYRIPRKEIGLFAKQLGTLLGAGIPLDEALNDVWEQTSNQHLKKVIAQIKQDIIEGKSLSNAMADHPEIFPPIYPNMVRVGEATGSYETTLDRLADLEEKNADLKGKAITALIYPVIMSIVMIVVVFFLLTFVVPQIRVLYDSFEGAKLPLITRFVLAISGIISGGWPYILLGMLGLSVALYRYRRTKKGRLRWDRKSLEIPFFGRLLTKIHVGRFSRNLGVLLESRVPLLSALEIVANTSDNQLLKNELFEAVVQIKEGASLRDSLKDSEVLPHMAKGMIAAGESTDRMAELLVKTANIMEREVDTEVKGLTTSLEPIIIVVMGVVVGGIMMAVMLPVFKISEFIK